LGGRSVSVGSLGGPSGERVVVWGAFIYLTLKIKLSNYLLGHAGFISNLSQLFI